MDLRFRRKCHRRRSRWRLNHIASHRIDVMHRLMVWSSPCALWWSLPKWWYFFRYYRFVSFFFDSIRFSVRFFAVFIIISVTPIAVVVAAAAVIRLAVARGRGRVPIAVIHSLTLYHFSHIYIFSYSHIFSGVFFDSTDFGSYLVLLI